MPSCEACTISHGLDSISQSPLGVLPFTRLIPLVMPKQSLVLQGNLPLIWVCAWFQRSALGAVSQIVEYLWLGIEMNVWIQAWSYSRTFITGEDIETRLWESCPRKHFLSSLRTVLARISRASLRASTLNKHRELLSILYFWNSRLDGPPQVLDISNALEVYPILHAFAAMLWLKTTLNLPFIVLPSNSWIWARIGT